MTDPSNELLAAMARFELNPGRIIWDGVKKRFPGPGKKKSDDSGWYIAFPDQRGAVFGDWSRTLKEHWKLNDGKKPEDLDPAEWERMKREMAEAQEEREIQKELKQEEVAFDCQARFKAAGPARLDHEYLVRKEIDSTPGIRQDGNELLIPMKALESNQIVSLQRIVPSGKKFFAEGGRVSGARTTIGAKAFKERKEILYVCEGWATGWAIHHVTGDTVIVAFTAANLEAAAVHHRKKFPDARIIIAADNDRWTETYRKGVKIPNPGMVFAGEAAQSANAGAPKDSPPVQVAMPDFVSVDGKPTDFGDLLLREGEDAVRKWLRPGYAPEAGATLREDPALPEQDPPPTPVPEEPEDDSVSWCEGAPFRCLGYDRATYYYLPRESGQVIALTPSAHDKKTLLPLAPLSWWETEFGKGNGVAWTVAGDALIRASHRAGVFRPDRLRGRGCWPDEEGVILHLGDRLLAPGATEYTDPEGFTCSEKLIYERLPRMAGPSMSKALDGPGARALLDLFLDLLWHEEASGHLLAGWTVLAPVCGALAWRPHVHLVGRSGSGKSTLLKQLVRPCLGGMVCHFEGGTTEAGIRQKLRADALPVVYDEAERTDARSDQRIQSVMSLARSASSTGSEIMKGTTHGAALSFQIRSMFCLASVGGAAKQEADRTRVSGLNLRGKGQASKHERQAHWERYQPKLANVDEALGRRLVARTLGWLRDGRLAETIKTFQSAASTVLGDARAGDQYGTLFAGAWTLMSEVPPTAIEAREQVESSALDFYSSPPESEGSKCLRLILQARERIDVKGGAPTILTVGELIHVARGRGGGGDLDPSAAKKVLRQIGLKCLARASEEYLIVANESAWIDKTLRESPYHGEHHGYLRQLNGVEPHRQTRFGGFRSYSTIVPMDLVDSDEPGE